jgi:hypothetical protein
VLKEHEERRYLKVMAELREKAQALRVKQNAAPSMARRFVTGRS